MVRQVVVRLTESECEQLINESREHRSVSDFVRQAIFEKIAHDRRKRAREENHEPTGKFGS